MSNSESEKQRKPMTRRDFLKVAAGAGAAAAVSACVAPAATPVPPPAAPVATAVPAATAAPAAQAVSIKHWYWVDDPTNKTYEALVQEFQAKYPNIKVQSELIGLNDLRNKLLTGLTAGDLPDVARFKDWWMPEFVKAGALEPIDAYIKNWKGNDVAANLWDLQRAKAGDPLYMVPWEAVYLYLYYRTDLFKEAGLAAPDTIDNFLKAAKALTKGDRYGYGMRGASGGDQAWAMLTYPNGLRFADDKGNIILDNDAAVAANQWYLDLFLKEKVCPPTAPADGFAQITGAIQAGTTAMTIHHVGSSAAMLKALGDNITAIPVPEGPKGRFAVAAVVYNVVFKSSKQKEAAFTFASYLAEKDPNDKWATGAGVLPIVASLQDKYAAKDRFYKASMDSVKYAGVYPQVVPLGNWTSNVWPATMQQALNGKIDSKTMMKTLADGLKA